jgi:phosphatidylserine/phosphatidylglycerophosphate/cardiolipin synthase-like enzyme
MFYEENMKPIGRADFSYIQQKNKDFSIEPNEFKAGEKKITQEELVNKTKKDLTFNFLGVTIKGIDKNFIKNSCLVLEIPLNVGHKKIIGQNKDAHLFIKKNTELIVFLKLTSNDQHELVIDNIKLSFNHCISIKNPTTSLLPGRQSSNLGKKIKDKLADVKLKNIEIDAQGNVNIDGKIKALHMLKKRLPKEISHIDLPNLHDIFLSLMFNESRTINNQAIRGWQQQIDLGQLLKQLGAIVQKANYKLTIEGDAKKISCVKKSNYLRGPKEPIDIKLFGTVDIDLNGDIFLNIDEKHSMISCSLGKYSPHVLAELKNIGINKTASLSLQANFKGQAKDLHLDSYSKKEVKPNQNLLSNKPTKVNNLLKKSIGAKSTDLLGSMNINAQLKETVLKANGSFSFHTKANAPYAKIEKYGVTMDGHLSTFLNMGEFSYSKEHGLEQGQGNLGFSIHPSKKIQKKFPELKPIAYQYDLEMRESQKARLIPPKYGITRFIRGIKNYEGYNERINSSLTKKPLYPIGCPKYFEQVEKITGAKLRKASRVKLLIDGINSMPERLRIINQANDYICFQTLVFKDDASGWLTAKALVNACRRGVRVYGVVDSLGNIEGLENLKNPHPIYEYLQENGVKLHIYNGSLEKSLRDIFQITKKYPNIFIDNPKSLTDAVQILGFLKRVIKAVQTNQQIISSNEINRLKNAIHMMLRGKKAVSPDIVVNELSDILVNNLAKLEDLALLIRRMGNVSHLWHEKYLIVDHKSAVVGGMNIADEYLQGGNSKTVSIKGKEQAAWRDTDVLLEGDIVVEVYRNFRRNWLHIAHQRLKLGPKLAQKTTMKSNDDYAVSMIQHRPFEDGDHKIVNYLLYNLRTLQYKEKAWFETAYFLPRGILRALQKELILAASRGVDVRIITNSESSSDFPPLVEAATFDVRELLQAGAKVYHRNNGRMVHAKVMVLGDKLTIIGSWNMDNRSASHDSEDICTIYNEKINREMTDVLIRDMQEQSYEITLKEINNRNIGQEIKAAGMLLLGELV